MGKRRGTKKVPNSALGSNNTISLREEATGKKQKKGGSSNAKHLSKVDHLERLALWASGEASMPSLAAFFGRSLASVRESLGVSPNPFLLSCQRCETILQPGFNCTVRIEKKKAKPRRRSKKPCISTKNSVVHTCHFCLHRNLKRGTPKGHMKEICPSKINTTKKSRPAKSNSHKPVSSEKISKTKDEVNKTDEPTLPPMRAMSGSIPMTESPATPNVRTRTTLLEGKKRKRNKTIVKKPVESGNSSIPTDAVKTTNMSSKRRRNSWTSLKEIADRSEQEKNQNVSNLSIPFFL